MALVRTFTAFYIQPNHNKSKIKILGVETKLITSRSQL